MLLLVDRLSYPFDIFVIIWGLISFFCSVIAFWETFTDLLFNIISSFIKLFSIDEMRYISPPLTLAFTDTLRSASLLTLRNFAPGFLSISDWITEYLMKGMYLY